MPSPIQFTDSSPRFSLPFLFPGQSQKEFFVNEAHALTDILLHAAIQGEETSPPGTVEDGQSWIVLEPPQGEWTGQGGKIAARQGGSWIYIAPSDGMQVFNIETRQFLTYDNGWMKPVAPAQPLGGQTVDSELRASFVSLVESLSIAGIFPVIE